MPVTSYGAKAYLPKLELCIAISPLIGHVKEIEIFLLYKSNLSYRLRLVRTSLFSRYWDPVIADACNSPARVNRDGPVSRYYTVYYFIYI